MITYNILDSRVLGHICNRFTHFRWNIKSSIHYTPISNVQNRCDTGSQQIVNKTGTDYHESVLQFMLPNS